MYMRVYSGKEKKYGGDVDILESANGRYNRQQIDAAKVSVERHLLEHKYRKLGSDGVLVGICLYCRGGEHNNADTGWYSPKSGIYGCHRTTCEANGKPKATEVTERFSLCIDSQATPARPRAVNHEPKPKAKPFNKAYWEQAKPAIEAAKLHPYLAKKGITSPPDYIRVVGNELLIPYNKPVAKDGTWRTELVAIQRIMPDGKKILAVGSKPNEAMLVIRGGANRA